MENLKEIHIGKLLSKKIDECNIDSTRMCRFFNSDSAGIEKMLQAKNLNSDILLKWCKLLEYDFFRLYSQHLIFYAPTSSINYKRKPTVLPKFKKNVYTREMIEHILETIATKSKTKKQIMGEYGIPRTTLYRWIKKYRR